MLSLVIRATLRAEQLISCLCRFTLKRLVIAGIWCTCLGVKALGCCTKGAKLGDALRSLLLRSLVTAGLLSRFLSCCSFAIKLNGLNGVLDAALGVPNVYCH